MINTFPHMFAAAQALRVPTVDEVLKAYPEIKAGTLCGESFYYIEDSEGERLGVFEHPAKLVPMIGNLRKGGLR